MVKLNRTLLVITIVCIAYLLSAYGDEKTSTPQLKAKQAHYDLGIELIRKGNTNEAIAEFRKAIEHDPLYTESHLKYIDLMERQGEKAEVFEEYKVKVQQNPSSEVYRRMMLRGRLMINRLLLIEDGWVGFLC